MLSDLIETFKVYPFDLIEEYSTLIARFIIEPE